MKDRHDIDYRNCQKMLLLYNIYFFPSIVFAKHRAKAATTVGAVGWCYAAIASSGGTWFPVMMAACPNRWKELFLFLSAHVFFLHGCTLSISIRSIQCRCNVLIWISAQRCDIVSFTKPPASCTSALETCWRSVAADLGIAKYCIP